MGHDIKYDISLFQRRPILQIKYVPTIDRLVMMIDNVVHVVDTLRYAISNSHDKLKNAHSYSVDEQEDKSNPFGRQVIRLTFNQFCPYLVLFFWTGWSSICIVSSGKGNEARGILWNSYFLF